MQNCGKIEILSPAGNAGTIEAAVRAGADAVYFGAPGFNARQNAKNLSFEDIENAVGYCAERNVRTYLTLNTLVADGEIDNALYTAHRAARCGVDAFIVQDIGLAGLLRQYLPDVPLHASTQLSVHSSAALPMLSEMGFRRVVPAREMDRESLISLCNEAKRLSMEVEVFVHGALCMCLSGQCYLSAVLGSRSGNRGFCAQPCRLPFAVAGGTGHDLSLKDMSFIEHIGELRDMGVCSLKIEGRMKRPEYVAAATAACRAAADGEHLPDDLRELLSGIFSRNGHTDGYFTGKTGRCMFGTRTENDEKMSAKLINTAHELYRNERRSVPLCAGFKLKIQEPSRLTISDRDGHEATVSGAVPVPAKSAAADSENVREKLSKLGGTPYYIDKYECDIENGLFIGAADLGSLKREAVDRISLQRRESAKRDTLYTLPMIKSGHACRRDIKTVARFKSAKQVPEMLPDSVAAVILPARDFENASLPQSVTLLAEIPRGVLKCGEAVVKSLKTAKANGAAAAVIGNMAGFTYASAAGLPAVAGIGMNIFNFPSVEQARSLGAAAAVASFELPIKAASSLCGDIPVGIITYGRLPLMCFKNCPGKNGAGCRTCGGKCELYDRMGERFPVMCDGEFSEMFNSRPLWMLDKPGDINKLDFGVLYFTDETRERCAEVIRAAENRSQPDCEFTRGLYYRGVL